MNTEDKDIKEEVVEQEDTTKENEQVVQEENTSKGTETKEDVAPKKEKKHSNKKTVLIVIGGFILFCVGAMILTGGWNPFKSETVEEVAVKNYKKSNDTPKAMWEEMYPELLELEKSSPYYKEMDAAYGPYGRLPYGFEILEDNGKDGGKDGVLKSMYTANTSYYDKYGMNYTVYYMKNEDYAKEKYNQLKNGDQGINTFRKEYTFSNGKVTIARGDDRDYMIFYIKVGTTIYYFEGLQSNYSADKIQPLLDKLGIKYTAQSLENIK